MNGNTRSRRVVVTPGMVELGPKQRTENARFAAAAAQVADYLVIVGRTNRRALVEGARSAQGVIRLVDNREQAVDWVRSVWALTMWCSTKNDLPDHYP